MAEDNRPLSQAEIDALLAGLTSADEGEAELAVKPATEGDAHEAPKMSGKTSSNAALWQDPRLKRTLNLPLTMTISLGTANLPINTVLNWGIGTQVVLNREWQEAVAVKVNGMALGEARVVLVDGNFGVQITRWGRDQ